MESQRNAGVVAFQLEEESSILPLERQALECVADPFVTTIELGAFPILETTSLLYLWFEKNPDDWFWH